MYTRIKGKFPENPEEVVLNFNAGAMCFGQWAGLRIRDNVPDKIEEVTEAVFGFYTKSVETEENTLHMQNVINLFQQIDWFPQELEVKAVEQYGDTFVIVDFHKCAHMPADKLIWCFKNIRTLFNYQKQYNFNKVAQKDPASLLLLALTTPSRHYGRLSFRMDYDWDDSNIYWELTTPEMYEKLMALEEPHWQQEPFFDKSKKRLNGYLKSFMMAEDYEFGDDPLEEEYTTEQGLPLLEIPLQYGLEPGSGLDYEFLEKEIEKRLGDII